MQRHLRADLLSTAEELADLGTWVMDLQTGEADWSDGIYTIFGIAPGSVPVTPEELLKRVHPEDRDRMAAVLERAQSDPDSLTGYGAQEDYRIVRPDGSVREIRGRGRVEAGDDGARLWLGIEQDVTDHRMRERELRAHYAVSQALREWGSFEEGVVVLLRRMATAVDYPVGTFWSWEPATQEVACRAVWTAPGLDASDWQAAARTVRFRLGEGLPGRCWAERETIVSTDVTRDPRVSRHEAVNTLGIHSALVIPAVLEEQTIAVLAFYSPEHRDAGARLRATLNAIGRDLGRFLAQRRAQLEPSPLSAREREVLQLAAEGRSGPQIAERLVVSPSTIKTHFENIYEKLGVGDRAGAVAYALRIGLIT